MSSGRSISGDSSKSVILTVTCIWGLAPSPVLPARESVALTWNRYSMLAPFLGLEVQVAIHRDLTGLRVDLEAYERQSARPLSPVVAATRE